MAKPTKAYPDSEKTTLLREKPLESDNLQRSNSALTQTLAGAANLANLLPTGTTLLFQVLCPLLSNHGHCDPTRRYMTEILLACCALSGLLASFTDSFRGSDGKIYYGFATLKGFYAFEYVSAGGAVPDPAKYRLRAVDFVHAFLSVLVFAAIALYDKNVVGCFYPAPEEETKELLDVLPVAIGLACSLLFLALPTTRHGVG
ncbi:hypothetical protein KI387_006404, partial [Taxus chinensis]